MKPPQNMIVPKGTKNWAFFKRIPVELREFFPNKRTGKDQTSFSETCGTPVFKDALPIFYQLAAKYEQQLADARLGRPTGSAYDTQKRKRIRQSKAAKKNIFAYVGAAGGDDWFDPAIMSLKDAIIYRENGVAEQRIAKLERDKLVGAIDVCQADQEIAALQHLIDGTVSENEKKSSTAPRLSAVLPEFLKELQERLAPVTYVKKENQSQTFLKTEVARFV